MTTSAHGTTLRYLQGCQDIRACQRCTAAWLRWLDEKDIPPHVSNRHGELSRRRNAHQRGIARNNEKRNAS